MDHQSTNALHQHDVTRGDSPLIYLVQDPFGSQNISNTYHPETEHAFSVFRFYFFPCHFAASKPLKRTLVYAIVMYGIAFMHI